MSPPNTPNNDERLAREKRIARALVILIIGGNILCTVAKLPHFDNSVAWYVDNAFTFVGIPVCVWWYWHKFMKPRPPMHSQD